MPVYEYECLDCDTKFEMLRPMKDYAEKGKCPLCGKLCERRMSACNFKVPPWDTPSCPKGSCNTK